MKRSAIVLFSFSVILGLICQGSMAQQVFKGTPIHLNTDQTKKLGTILKDPEIFQLNLEELNRVLTHSKEANIVLETPKGFVTKIAVYNHDIRSTNYKESLSTKVSQEVSRSITYRGKTDAGGTVRLTVNNEFIYGMVEEDNTYYTISQLKYLIRDKTISSSILVIYDHQSIIDSGEQCGTDEETIKKSIQNRQASPSAKSQSTQPVAAPSKWPLMLITNTIKSMGIRRTIRS